MNINNYNATRNIIVLFDGECMFCNFWVNFLLDRDPNDVFRFAALQSDVAKSLLEKHSISYVSMDTFIVVKDELYYERAAAALTIAASLGYPWKIAVLLKIFPISLLNAVYNIVAKNRYKLWGKQECRFPSPEERKKFL